VTLSVSNSDTVSHAYGIVISSFDQSIIWVSCQWGGSSGEILKRDVGHDPTGGTKELDRTHSRCESARYLPLAEILEEVIMMFKLLRKPRARQWIRKLRVKRRELSIEFTRDRNKDLALTLTLVELL
jgi:hypothetical protein